jgi:hypothetical protein
MYSLPHEFWKRESLEGIGNTLRSLVIILKVTNNGRYTSYSHICVYINVSKYLLEPINIIFQDVEWIYTLDYEHILFQCHKLHEHGHIFRYYPQIVGKIIDEGK